MNQNDIYKRHQNDINDISKKSFVINSLFRNPHDEVLYACAQKLGKIAAAIHLVADIMEGDSSLARDLHMKALMNISKCYRCVGKNDLKADEVMGVVLGIDETMALVDIGSIARSISKMNSEIILGELIKVREVIIDILTTIQKTEQSFVLSQYAVAQPVIQDEIINDSLFDQKLRDYQSKRHQNDIKTTLITQIDNQSDILKTKTTSVNDIPRVGRQKDILNLIKSSNLTTLATLKLKIPDCSEKTLQRELATLIDMGLIRKEGNKRWTVYRAV